MLSVHDLMLSVNYHGNSHNEELPQANFVAVISLTLLRIDMDYQMNNSVELWVIDCLYSKMV